MYKLDKSLSATQSLTTAEDNKKFPPETPLGERLKQSWFLTCAAYGIDPENPPPMEKSISSTRKRD